MLRNASSHVILRNCTSPSDTALRIFQESIYDTSSVSSTSCEPLYLSSFILSVHMSNTLFISNEPSIVNHLFTSVLPCQKSHTTCKDCVEEGRVLLRVLKIQESPTNVKKMFDENIDLFSMLASYKNLYAVEKNALMKEDERSFKNGIQGRLTSYVGLFHAKEQCYSKKCIRKESKHKRRRFENSLTHG